MKTNITLKIDESLAREAKVLAAKRGTSLSRLVADEIETIVRGDKAYNTAKRRAFMRLDKGFDLGWHPPADRDELHER